MEWSETPNSRLDDLLSAISDALLAEQDSVDHIVDQYGVARAEVDDLIGLMRNLRHVLTWQQPADRFIRQLRQDLMANQPGLLGRLQSLPARVQIAAGFTLMAGVMLISRRRPQETHTGVSEIPALQQ
jgi:hypothetical protein